MKLSTDRILTTHVGSLPRPQYLLDQVLGKERGEAIEPKTLDATAARAVEEIVALQVQNGVDVVSDGEMSKLSYAFYVKDRMNGIGHNPAAAEKSRYIMTGRDMLEHPDYAERVKQSSGYVFQTVEFPACIGPVSYADTSFLEQDLAHMKSAVAKAKPTDAFLNAASPGVLTKYVIDTYYEDEDAYVEALGKAMKTEYEAIVAAGFNLQIDCPDLASARNNQYREKSDQEFRRIAERNVAAINLATANIPPEKMRMHICWGNYEGPHTHDVPLSMMIDICFKARPSALLFEGANPRHEHEWEDLAAVKIPDDKVLIPGVVDSTSNFVEHPRLIAQRLCRYADIVGRERVLAGGDCGFSTVAYGHTKVAPSIVWAKFRAMAEGARIASEKLWH